MRGHDIRDPVDAGEISLRPWAAELLVPDDVVELSFATAGGEGLDPEALVDDDWTACQAWVARVRPPAIIAPSSALPGTSNVVLFGSRVRSRYGVAPIDADVDVPCDPVADAGVLVTDLLSYVRWKGTPHAGLEAWRAGRPEPLPPAVSTTVLAR